MTLTEGQLEVIIILFLKCFLDGGDLVKLFLLVTHNVVQFTNKVYAELAQLVLLGLLYNLHFLIFLLPYFGNPNLWLTLALLLCRVIVFLSFFIKGLLSRTSALT